MTREEKRQINNHLQKIGGANNLKKKSSNDLDLTEVYSFFNFWEIFIFLILINVGQFSHPFRTNRINSVIFVAFILITIFRYKPKINFFTFLAY